VAEKLDHSDEALAAYNRAYDLDATYLPALEGLGNLLVRRRQFDEALKIFQAILIHHRDELTDLEVVEIHWQIGETHRALSQNDRAIKSYEKALEIDPGHEPSHQALAELLEASGDFEGALEHRQKLLDTLEGDARFDASVQLARLSRDRLDDPYQAIDAYLQALKLRPIRWRSWKTAGALPRHQAGAESGRDPAAHARAAGDPGRRGRPATICISSSGRCCATTSRTPPGRSSTSARRSTPTPPTSRPSARSRLC
jgi:tetratricopeptide (TPR) repeat protein